MQGRSSKARTVAGRCSVTASATRPTVSSETSTDQERFSVSMFAMRRGEQIASWLIRW
jgi:hypothetical protein